jgi:RNA polymerase sigma factor (TIGR02999 family)
MPSAKPAVDQLMPLLEAELRRLAAQHLACEPKGHTLQPTALVNEAYLRLVSQCRVDPGNKAQLLALAAIMFRRILVDHAKRKSALKRGPAHERVTLTGMGSAAEERMIDVLALEEALQRLSRIDAEKSRVVELRYFGGLTLKETAMALDVSRRHVDSVWACAKSWLKRELLRDSRP